MADKWDSSLYDDRHSFVWKKVGDLIDVLDPKRGERILDLGCGTGHLTAQIAARGAVVTGLDSSVSMTAQARQNYPKLTFVLGDASDFRFDEPFDAVFSNAALHWIKDDPDAPIACAFRALRNGGRFVGELGGHACVGAITVALVATLERRGVNDAASRIPWYFPTAEDYEMRLRRAGFVPQSVQLIPRPTPLPTGMRGWLDTFANPFSAALPCEERCGFLDEVTALLKPILCDADGNWTADYTRLRFAAIKP